MSNGAVIYTVTDYGAVTDTVVDHVTDYGAVTDTANLTLTGAVQQAQKAAGGLAEERAVTVDEIKAHATARCRHAHTCLLAREITLVATETCFHCWFCWLALTIVSRKCQLQCHCQSAYQPQYQLHCHVCHCVSYSASCERTVG